MEKVKKTISNSKKIKLSRSTPVLTQIGVKINLENFLKKLYLDKASNNVAIICRNITLK